MKKLFRVTTISDSLNTLLKGQLSYMNNYYEVVGVANDIGNLQSVGEREGIRTIHIPMAREINLKCDLRSLFQLYRLFKKERPHIVHANTPKASLLSMIAALLARVPHRIYTVTGVRFETTKGVLRFILKTMERITCLCATKVIPEGDGVKQTLKREHITSKPLSKIHYGNINGIDLEYFSRNNEVVEKSRLYKTEKLFTFIFIGRLVTEKGVNELIKAFDLLSNEFAHTRLFLLGKFEDELDPILPQTKQIIESNNHIEYLGYQNDVRPFLAASDMLILPSYREGFPNVVIQAGAMGLPCIVTDISGCNEIILPDKNGLIIPKQNTNALFDAMKFAIQHPKQIKGLADNARELISSRFSQHEVWAEILKMYNSL